MDHVVHMMTSSRDEMQVQFEELLVLALGPLCSLQSQKKISGEKRWAIHLLYNEENEKGIEGYMNTKTTDAG